MTTNRSRYTLQQLQGAVHAWISQWDDGYRSPLANLARLTEEVGELSREINHQHGEKKKKSSEAEGSIAEELGDILFVVTTLANQLDVDLDDAMHATFEKYNVRDADRHTRKEDG